MLERQSWTGMRDLWTGNKSVEKVGRDEDGGVSKREAVGGRGGAKRDGCTVLRGEWMGG